MAGRLTFHYFPGDTILHRWDVRCKFPALLLSAIGFLYMDGTGLFIFSCLFAVLLGTSGISARALAGDLKNWVWFLLIIFVFQAFSSQLDGTVPPGWWPHGYETAFGALIGIWRLILIICYAMLFSMITRPRDLQEAVIWYLRPFPFLPARRIALMISLMLRFLPLILDQADEVDLATRARLGNRRKNPILRMKYFVLPLFRRSIKRADNLALALAARGYRDDLPFSYTRLPMKHLAGLVPLIIMVVVLAGWFPQNIPQKWNALVGFAMRVLS